MHLDISRIRALCFDVDGTLVDTDEHLVALVAVWLARFRFLFPGLNPMKTARKIVMGIETPGNRLLHLLDRLAFDEPIARLGDLLHRTGRRRRIQYKLIPGVKEALLELQPHFPMAIVSARGAHRVNEFIDQFELQPLFDHIISGQTRFYTKPHPAPILFAAEQMGFSPSACLMVGDTTVDILAGRAAGAQTVGVLCGFGEEEELRSAGADLILNSTAALPEILLRSL